MYQVNKLRITVRSRSLVKTVDFRSHNNLSDFTDFSRFQATGVRDFKSVGGPSQIPTYAQQGGGGLDIIGALSSLPASNFIIVDRKRYNRIVY